ncbi:MAG: DUF4031 domain-containing protein [Acidimicrobiales bacterium]
MGILVDRPLWWFRGERWAHLVSDESFAELHRFASSIGIPRRAFQGDHYDIPESRLDDVIAAGARPVDPREIVRALREGGMRRSRHEGLSAFEFE